MVKQFNKDYELTMYEVKKQSLSLNEFLDFRNWVCSRLIDEDDMEINYDLAGIIMQFAFAKFYLNIELPNIDTKDELDDYDLVSMVNPNDYADYINWTQYVELDASIQRYLSKIQRIYDENNKYSVEEFLQDIILSINNFTNGLVSNLGNIEGLDLEELYKKLNEFSLLSDNKIDSEEFLDYVLREAKEDEITKDNEVEKTLEETEENKNVN